MTMLEQAMRAFLEWADFGNFVMLVGITFLLSLAVSFMLLAQPKPRRSGFELTYKPETAVRLDPLEPANDH
ncbi:hypothetical protein JYU29_05105 [Tianweitania sp. BSSL-BM11]|uniref:CcoQ/FixQ family Cbb3-type cytochrome c oxidase assembly chaperone n=1 Tax=Tianweitania aestuarii TaxID=2814886 RepID=A0ABS5RTD1_9HYPH|nr:hypothetical protein [Tianweitania aestuarii]MBS9720065.1 hypothetical protein [Tianweitania aestuarii]